MIACAPTWLPYFRSHICFRGPSDYCSTSVAFVHYLWSLLCLLFNSLEVPPWMLKDQQVPVTAGTWANVVGRLKNRVTPQILSSLSYKKTQTCATSKSQDSLKPPFSWNPSQFTVYRSVSTQVSQPLHNSVKLSNSFCVFCVTLGKVTIFKAKRMTFKVFLILLNVRTGPIWPKQYGKVNNTLN